MTSYNPFGFSKVAYVHDLLRQAVSPEMGQRDDIFCQRQSARTAAVVRFLTHSKGFPLPLLPFLPRESYTAFL
jgi:hypothetical protein